MIPFSLWLLATIDASMTGYRVAAGRNALISKRAYFRRAMGQGALFGQIAVAVTGVVILVLLLLSADPAGLRRDLEAVGSRMLMVYTPYAIVILFAFLLRIFPSVDIRSITSVVVFGPFTLIRPFVAIAGIAWGLLAAPRPVMLSLGILVLVLMFSLGPALAWARSHSIIHS